MGQHPVCQGVVPAVPVWCCCLLGAVRFRAAGMRPCGLLRAARVHGNALPEVELALGQLGAFQCMLRCVWCQVLCMAAALWQQPLAAHPLLAGLPSAGY